MRLRTQLALALSGLSLVVLGMAAVLTLWSEDRYLTRKDREEQVRTLKNFADGCAQALLRPPPGRGPGLPQDRSLVDYVFSVSRSPGLAFAGLFLEDGKAVFHSDPALQGARVISPDDVRGLLSKKGSEFIQADLYSGRPHQIFTHTVEAGPIRGVAAIGYDPEVLRSRRMRAMGNNLRRTAGITLGALALSVLLALYISALLTKPISELAQGAREIGSGRLGHRIAAGRKDEIGELSAEFNRMAEGLEEVDRLKEEFLASVTHELRSPLSSVIGFADLLLSGEEGPLTPKQEEWAETIQRSGRRLSRMVNNILDIAKVEAGLMDFAPAETDLSCAAQETAALFEPQAKEQGVTLKVLAGEPAPAWADPETVSLAFTNLVANALKFTPEGGTVTVEVFGPSALTGGRARASVSDTGPGIPQAALDKLFSKFFQVSETKGRARGKGTGLGLYLCKRLLEAQAGDIRAANRPEGGAVFSFTLPPASSSTPPRDRPR